MHPTPTPTPPLPLPFMPEKALDALQLVQLCMDKHTESMQLVCLVLQVRKVLFTPHASNPTPPNPSPFVQCHTWHGGSRRLHKTCLVELTHGSSGVGLCTAKLSATEQHAAHAQCTCFTSTGSAKPQCLFAFTSFEPLVANINSIQCSGM